MEQLERRFVLKNSIDITTEYYFRDNIIFCNTKENDITMSKEIIHNVFNDFYVILDEQDHVHLLCQDLSGNIIYHSFINDKWEQEIILLSKIQEAYRKHLYMIISDNIIYFFFIIKNNNNWLLIQQRKFENKTSEPIVIDSINLSSKPFNVCREHSGSIICFYNKLFAGYNQMGYKIFDPEYNRWSSYNFVSSSNSNCSVPSLIIDNHNTLHISYLKQNSQTINIIYQKKSFNKGINNKWCKEYLLESTKTTCQNLYMAMLDENLCAVWISNNELWISSYSLSGDWSIPIIYNSENYEAIYEIYYFTNILNEKERLIGNTFLGSNDKSLQLIPISNILSQSDDCFEESAAAAEKLDDFTNINLYLENIKSYISKIINKTVQIEKQKNDIIREIETLKKSNTRLREQASNMNNTVDYYDTLNKELRMENEELKKRNNNFNDLLLIKESDINKYCKKISELSNTNSQLLNELISAKNDLDIELNRSFIKKVFSFKKKFIPKS